MSIVVFVQMLQMKDDKTYCVSDGSECDVAEAYVLSDDSCEWTPLNGYLMYMSSMLTCPTAHMH